jgi:6-pyruvoyltetrahydropterin/6-carboxytetrahydropterin synthase
VELTRTVRFAVDLAPKRAGVAQPPVAAERQYNSLAGLPSMVGLGLHCEIVVGVAGQPDARTGYLLNISEIDAAVREAVVPLLAKRVNQGPTDSAERLLGESLRALEPRLAPHLRSVRWNLTPYYWLTMNATATDRVLMTQSFEFAAAHRLHCEEFDAETNRRIFGKCNNPSGHGHNYRLEVTVETPLDGQGVSTFTLQSLERIVHETVIRRFDHKHLNLDTAEFANVNPSVENIARASHGLLAEPIRAAGASLARVTVWETEKTSCTYPAGA